MTDTTLLDYAESAGLENLRNHLTAADSLSKEANTTLTILLAGSAGSLGYAVKLFEASTPSYAAVGLGATCLYLFSLSAFLVWRCMKVADMPSPTNEPLNLYQDNFPLEQIRQAELKNIQQRIQQATERNGATAYWLNRLRLLAAATPVIFLLAILFFWVVTLF